MKKFCISIFFLFANFASCLWLDKCFAGDAQVKIAIIADESLREYADILTAELSKEKDLALLERSEIDKILKEQQVSAENLDAKSIELGRLFGASGLIILKKINFDKKEFIVSRLVAVNTGVILGATFQPFPPEKLDKWLKGIQTRFLPLLPKLKVPSKDAVPISILNIRAPIDTPELKLLEKEFTLALAFRLIQEKEIFVLERWKMEKLAWEKDLEPAEKNPFWTGSYLLDGSIELVGDDSIKVVVRLRKPAGEELRLEETGKKDKISEVTDKLTIKILQELGKSSEKINWDAKAEAEQYLKEAEWAYDAGLFDNAVSSIENAVALGDRSLKSLFLEVKTNSTCAYPLKENIGRAWGHGYSYDPKLIDVSISSCNVEYAISSLELLNKNILDNFLELKKSTKMVHQVYKISDQAILNASIVLRAYYDQNCHGKDIEETKYLRKLLRDSYKKISQIYSVYGISTSFFIIKASHIPFWYETPEESLKAYNELFLEQPFKNEKEYLYDIMKWLFFEGILEEVTFSKMPNQAIKKTDSKNQTPFLIDWTDERDKSKLDEKWMDFIERLCSSDNKKLKYAGLYIKSWYFDATGLEGENTALNELLKLSWDERWNIADRNSDFPPFSAYQFKVPCKQDKEKLTEYYFKYTRFWLDEYSKRNNFKYYYCYFKIFGAWLKDSSIDQALEIYPLLIKFQEPAREKVKSTTKYDYTNSFVNDLLKKYPELMKEKKRALKVSKIWTPFDSGQVHDFWNFSIDHIGERNSTLCIVASPHIFLVKSDLSSETIDFPQDKSCYSFFDVSSRFVVGLNGNNGKIIRYDMVGKKWDEFEIIPKKYKAIKIIGKDLFISFASGESSDSPDSGIIRLNMGDGKSTIIANSRRNPPQSPLDNIQAYNIDNILQITPEIVLFSVIHREKPLSPDYLTYNVSTNEWNELLSLDEEIHKGIFRHKIVLDFFTETKDLYERYVYGGCILPILGMNRNKTIFLHYNSTADVPPRFASLKEWKSSGMYLNPGNKNLYYNGEIGIYLTKKAERPSSDICLLVFNSKKPDGVEIPLEFEMDKEKHELLAGKLKFNKSEDYSKWIKDYNDYVWIEGTGLFIKSYDSAILWFIPQSDLEEYLK